ncbi:MAG: phosphotransferase, partial [Deltaproteobacteria bacterium]|nr:phosphotransferase [Deltaproteobacteria bacterium]
MENPGWREVRDRWPGARVRSPLASGLGGRNTLMQLDLGGRTAVLKRANAGTAAVERAALGRLGGRVAPALLAEGPGWLLMEDLGGETPAADAAWLTALGAAVGRVHADTAGIAWGQPPVEIDHAAFRWRRALQALPVGLAAAGTSLAGAAARQLLDVVRVLENPGSLRVLSHGDLCLANT